MATLRIPILDLKPAQLAIGLLEVEHRMKVYAHMSKEEFLEYSREHPVPVVQTSRGYYIIDRHHFCRAFHELGHRHVYLTIQTDFSKFDPPKFWELMETESLALPQVLFDLQENRSWNPFSNSSSIKGIW